MLENNCCFPLLCLKGSQHYWKHSCLFFSGGLKQQIEAEVIWVSAVQELKAAKDIAEKELQSAQAEGVGLANATLGSLPKLLDCSLGRHERAHKHELV